MSIKSLGDPFSGESDLRHSKSCGCEACATGKHHHAGHDHHEDTYDLASMPAHSDMAADGAASSSGKLVSSEEMLDRAIESAVVRSVFGHNEISRRSFAKMVGSGTMMAALASVLPRDKVKAAILDDLGTPEKTKLNIGFVPITCATPIIMAQPMGFYEKYGLDVDVIKTAGWAVARDKSLNNEYDASHMLTPMPLAITMGAGSTATPFLMPAVENINGQAIVLHNDHLDKRDPKQWHNFLLRYYVAEHGLDPDKDIQIRVVPPPEMVANLRAGNLDGYLSPDPFNQRAVWEKIGFIHTLTKDIWEGHPCCAFACSKAFADEMPNTYGALLKSIVDATQYASKPENRKEISAAIAPANGPRTRA